MPNISLPVSNGNLPEGACFANEQERLNAFVQATAVTFPFNYAVYNIGSTAPTADNRLYPWFRFNMDGTPDKWYAYVNGFWIAPNPVPASSPISQFYRGSLGSIDTYDGGESGAVTDTTGPMWQVDEDMSGRMALGVSDDFAYNTTGGLSEVSLTEAQNGPHTHTLSNGNLIMRRSGGTQDGQGGNDITTVTLVINSSGEGEPHENMPPYRAGYWIKRTTRIFYRL